MSEYRFNKVMAANRGEIAIRIFRACHDLGIRTLAIYSKEDTLGLFRTKATKPISSEKSGALWGLTWPSTRFIPLAKRRKVEAIHPGYGFLSENAQFAKACEEAGITFIGPPSNVLAKMGDKLEAKKIAVSLRRAGYSRLQCSPDQRRGGFGKGQRIRISHHFEGGLGRRRTRYAPVRKARGRCACF